VVFQTIGLDGNVPAFHDMFDDWAQVLKPQRPEVPAEAWDSFRANMYDTGQVLFNVDEAWIEQCQTPLLVLLGNDLYHPESSSRTLHRLASNSTLVENWKEPEHHATAMAAVEEFLSAHTAL
ncbi:MAG: alpha/beta hydrolase, partial [Actinomycetota bacterium]|nr:alpha/beta hydrolase [Actinomycetota bacterium]